MPPSRAQTISDTAHVASIGESIEASKATKMAKLGNLVDSAQQKLQTAQGIVNGFNSLIGSSSTLKGLADEIFAPARAVLSVLEAVADIHPAVKAVAVLARKAIEVQIKVKQNDDQVAVVYFTMSTMLILLSDLDVVFDQEELQRQLKDMLDAVQKSVQDFGNFCEVYYREHKIKRYLKCGSYKDKLTGFASSFDGHKSALHELLQGQTALKVIDIQTDVKKVLEHITNRSAKEKEAEDFVEGHGGIDAVLKDDDALKELAKSLSEKLDIGELRRSMRVDLERTLKANAQAYELQIEQATARLENQLDGHTRTIIDRLEEGPHMYIEDEDIRAVWKEMGSRLSAKTRIFLDAVHAYFSRIYAKHEYEMHEPHPDAWTLHFLSKVIFYPAIAEGIDQDSSGFVSVHEVNSFLESRPAGWSVAQWIAFWAAGPYKTDEEHQTKIGAMVDDLTDLVDEIEKAQPQNHKRVKYFAAMTKRLNLLEIYVDEIEYIEEGARDDGAYAALEKLRIIWRNQEIKRIKANLEQVHYQLQGVEAVNAVINGCRLEQAAMCLIRLLLHHHMKIVRLATQQTVSVAEFQDMRDTWDYFFDAVDNRMWKLVDVWRQQRLDVKIQVMTFARGLFEDWYQRDADQTSDDEDSGSDSDSSDSSEDEGEKNAEGGEENNAADVEDGMSELASVLDEAEHNKSTKADPKSLLQYPVPEGPEDEAGLTTDSEESEWESAETRMKKANAAINERLPKIEQRLEAVESIEKRLQTIEGLLQQLLSGKTSTTPAPTTEAAKEETATVPPAASKAESAKAESVKAESAKAGEDSDAEASESGSGTDGSATGEESSDDE